MLAAKLVKQNQSLWDAKILCSPVIKTTPKGTFPLKKLQDRIPVSLVVGS